MPRNFWIPIVEHWLCFLFQLRWVLLEESNWFAGWSCESWWGYWLWGALFNCCCQRWPWFISLGHTRFYEGKFIFLYVSYVFNGSHRILLPFWYLQLIPVKEYIYISECFWFSVRITVLMRISNVSIVWCSYSLHLSYRRTNYS